MPQIDIITGEDRHRRWTLEEKQSIVAAAFAPGVVAAHVAKRANVSTGQLYTWRKQLMKKGRTAHGGFSQVMAIAEQVMAVPPPACAPLAIAGCDLPVIELDIRGHKVRIPATMPVALASAVVRALVRR